MAETAEDLSKHRDVREALDQTSGRKTRAPEKADRFWFVTYLVLLVACGILYYLAGSGFSPLTKPQVDPGLAR